MKQWFSRMRLITILLLMLCLQTGTAAGGAEDVELEYLNSLNVTAYGAYAKCAIAAPMHIVVTNKGNEPVNISLMDHVRFNVYGPQDHTITDMRYMEIPYDTNDFRRTGTRTAFTNPLVLPAQTTYHLYGSITNVEQYSQLWNSDYTGVLQVDDRTINIIGLMKQLFSVCDSTVAVHSTITEASYNSDGGGKISLAVTNEDGRPADVKLASAITYSGGGQSGTILSVNWDISEFTLAYQETRIVNATFTMSRNYAATVSPIRFSTSLDYKVGDEDYVITPLDGRDTTTLEVARRDGNPDISLSKIDFCRDFTVGNTEVNFSYVIRNESQSMILTQLATTMGIFDQGQNYPTITYTSCTNDTNTDCMSRIDSDFTIVLNGDETLRLNGNFTASSPMKSTDQKIYTSLVYYPDPEEAWRVLNLGDANMSCAITTQPSATPTQQPSSTNTPVPSATATQQPSNTNTPVPSATATLLASNTNTPLPSATVTLLASSTNTPVPSATATQQPSNTNTPVPSATATLLASSTSTPVPSATATLLAINTNTPLPSATTSLLAINTNTPLPSATTSLLAINTNTSLLNPSATLPVSNANTPLLNPSATLLVSNADIPLLNATATQPALISNTPTLSATTSGFSAPAASATTQPAEGISPVIVSGNNDEILINQSANDHTALQIQLQNTTNKDSLIKPMGLSLASDMLTDYQISVTLLPINQVSKSIMKSTLTLSYGESFILPAGYYAVIELILPQERSVITQQTSVNWNFQVDNQLVNYKANSETTDTSTNTAQQENWHMVFPGFEELGNLPVEILPETGFPANIFTALSAQPKNLKIQPLDEVQIEIPSLDSRAHMVLAPFSEGKWQVTWIGKDAGLLEGSALPGEGVSVIAAHNHINSGEIGPFAFLNQLDENERIFISLPDRLLVYRVYKNQLVNPYDLQAVWKDAVPNGLVLITCENELSSGGYADRRIVFAQLLEE